MNPLVEIESPVVEVMDETKKVSLPDEIPTVEPPYVSLNQDATVKTEL